MCPISVKGCCTNGRHRTIDAMNAALATIETPTRTRTRNAILKAAVSLLSENQAAALGDIADAASVARSTLHRYFPERADLLGAVSVYAAEQLGGAVERARPNDGPGREALMRLCHEYFDHWDTITWVYMESLKGGEGDCDPGSGYDPDLSALIARGQADGTIDPALPVAWLNQLVWALLYTAWEYVRQGESKHQALELTLRSLHKVVTPGSTVPAYCKSRQ